MTMATPPMPPVPGGFRPAGRRGSRAGVVLLAAAGAAVLAVVLATALSGLGGDENRAGAGASGAAAPAKSPKASPADYEGTWTGNVREPDGGLYSIRVDYTGGKPGDRVASVNYPSLECGGRWVLTMDTGHSVRIREEITEETSPLNCLDEVDIVLTPSGDGRLRYEVEGAGDSATLRRSK